MCESSGAILTAQSSRSFASKLTGGLTRRLLASEELESFEVAQLCNLAPEDSNEAQELIPSLKRLNDETLERIVNELANLRYFEV